MNPTQPRLQATHHLLDVLRDKKTLDQALTADTEPLVRELVSGTLRHYYSLAARVDYHLRKPLRNKDLDLKLLLLLGAYQLVHTRIPSHAAVSETVDCTKKLKKPWARGLVNAVLRAITNDPQAGLKEVADNPLSQVELDHPTWFIEHTQHALPDHWQTVLQANNTRAPMSIRINQLKLSPATYQQKLQSAQIVAKQNFANCPETLTLDSPFPQRNLPGFEDGEVAVQDACAQLASTLVEPELEPAQRDGRVRVLDACAAPGGKAFHLLEKFPKIALTLLDNSASRIATLRQQAARLGHEDLCHIDLADATELGWWDRTPFDLVLLDAPCSGSGTVRRHPDIKLLRSPSDLVEMAELQARLLINLWHTLRPGGSLLYSTCSLFQEENDAVIDRFITSHGDAKIVTLRMPEGVPMTHGWQTLPSKGGGDGFFYAKLTKHNTNPGEQA